MRQETLYNLRIRYVGRNLYQVEDEDYGPEWYDTQVDDYETEIVGLFSKDVEELGTATEEHELEQVIFNYIYAHMGENSIVRADEGTHPYAYEEEFKGYLNAICYRIDGTYYVEPSEELINDKIY